MNAVEGIVPPMITPLLDDDKLDYKGIEKLTEHLISGGVNGLFILGTTGEGPSLEFSLKLDLIKRVCNQVNGRIPVLVGIIDSSYKESIYLSNESEKLGAQSVVLTTPFYYQIDQLELYNFTEQLIREISLPVYLYNNPGLTKVYYETDTLRKLLLMPEIIGLKDSSGNMVYFNHLLKLTEEFDRSLLMGPEELFVESLLMGANGGVPGGANIFPELFVEIYDLFNSGDLKKARDLHNKVMKLSEIVYSSNGYGSSNVISGIKCALAYLDICNDYVAKPLSKVNSDKAKRIKKYLSGNRL